MEHECGRTRLPATFMPHFVIGQTLLPSKEPRRTHQTDFRHGSRQSAEADKTALFCGQLPCTLRRATFGNMRGPPSLQAIGGTCAHTNGQHVAEKPFGAFSIRSHISYKENRGPMRQQRQVGTSLTDGKMSKSSLLGWLPSASWLTCASTESCRSQKRLPDSPCRLPTLRR